LNETKKFPPFFPASLADMIIYYLFSRSLLFAVCFIDFFPTFYTALFTLRKLIPTLYRFTVGTSLGLFLFVAFCTEVKTFRPIFSPPNFVFASNKGNFLYTSSHTSKLISRKSTARKESN
jgi:hypothetical protein